MTRTAISRLPLGLVCALALGACEREKPAPAAANQPAATVVTPPMVPRAEVKRVYSIDSVTLEAKAGPTRTIEVVAHGTVRTGGWSQGELRPIQTFAPEKGVRTFTFVAVSPRSDMMVAQSLTPIEAQLVLPDLPPDVTRIKIMAETNELTETLP